MTYANDPAVVAYPDLCNYRWGYLHLCHQPYQPTGRHVHRCRCGAANPLDQTSRAPRHTPQEPTMQRYDPNRPRWKQGLLNWLWLLWPTCRARNIDLGPLMGQRCRRTRWHRGDHATVDARLHPHTWRRDGRSREQNRGSVPTAHGPDTPTAR